MAQNDSPEAGGAFRRLHRPFHAGGDPGQKAIPDHVGLAGLLVVAGIGIVSPGLKDALLAALNKWFGLGLSLDAPYFVGFPLIVAGIGVYLYGEHGTRQERKLAAAQPPGTFIALHHQSFEPPTARLPDSAAPSRLGRRIIRHIECDQSVFFSAGKADPAAAVRQQERILSDISANRRADPDAATGYYGIVHVPLQFLAGCSVSTWPKIALFELTHTDQRWHELERGRGPDLRLTVQTLQQPPVPAAIAIRIAISYEVPVSDVADVIEAPFKDIRIGLTPPRLDAVTHYGQVEAICLAFRRVLDDIHELHDRSVAVHVFFAGPVSVGFSLGRQISQTIHHRVIVYNYSARATPRYAWAIEINGDPGTTPRVLQPVLAIAPQAESC